MILPPAIHRLMVGVAAIALFVSAVPAAVAQPTSELAAASTVQAPATKARIVTQPVSRTAAAGGITQFSVRANGVGLIYLWQQRLPRHSWATLAGTKSNNHYVAVVPALNKAQYRVLVRNGGGEVISAVATLTVQTFKAHISSQPVGAHVVSGQTADFSVSASGYKISYRWQGMIPGKSWAYIAGANRNHYSITGLVVRNGYQFRAVISNAGGQTVSRAVRLAVDGTRSDPSRAGTIMNLTNWQVIVGKTNPDAASQVANLGPPPATGYRYVAVFVDVGYVGDGSADAWLDLDLAFIGGDGRTYTSTSKLYWSNNIYAINPLYYGGTGEFADIVEVPAGAVRGGRWRIDDTSDFSRITTAWYGLT